MILQQPSQRVHSLLEGPEAPKRSTPCTLQRLPRAPGLTVRNTLRADRIAALIREAHQEIPKRPDQITKPTRALTSRWPADCVHLRQLPLDPSHLLRDALEAWSRLLARAPDRLPTRPRDLLIDRCCSGPLHRGRCHHSIRPDRPTDRRCRRRQCREGWVHGRHRRRLDTRT